jgi:predicted ATPase
MKRVMINNIYIDHVRHLHDIRIALGVDAGTARHLMLTGKNGSGKTSVLDAIAGYIEAVCADNCPWDLSQRQDARHGIDLEFNMDDTDVRASYVSGDCIFAHFGAQRSFVTDIPTHIAKVQFADRYGIHDSPRQQFVRYLLDLKMTQALAATGGRRERADEIQRWFNRLRDIMRDIYEDPTLTLEFDEETYEFSICEQGREPFGFNDASDGFSAILDIVLGLMLRMVRKNGRATTFDMPGIALVDEVENHLHLSLQKRVLPILTGLFPNIQFIVTTHSPFVLSSLDSAVVYDLESKTLVSGGLADNTYESIVVGYFNVDALSDELRQKYDRYATLSAKDELSEGELLEAGELEIYLDEIPDYLAPGIATEYQRMKLELRNRVVGQ